MTECGQCGQYMNPVQVILSSTHGVCGDCCRKNQKFAFIKEEKTKGKNDKNERRI